MRLLPVLRGVRVDPERHVQLDRRLRRLDHHFGHHRQGRLDFIVRRLEHQFVVDG